jgi:transcriptional regulator with XRE-family HTH domain
MPSGSSQNRSQERLNRLFEDRHVTYRKVIKGRGRAIQEVYLWKLRASQASNPSYRINAALAKYFNVSPGYFFGDENPDDLTLLITRLNGPEGGIVRKILANILNALSNQLKNSVTGI